MSIDNKIKELGFELPNAADPVGSYVAAKIVGKLLYISGQISIDKDGKLIKGKIGGDLTVEDGYKAAGRCALSIVSQAKKACENDLSKINSDFISDISCSLLYNWFSFIFFNFNTYNWPLNNIDFLLNIPHP